jgi:DNA polymerase elongation subunit (family B)
VRIYLDIETIPPKHDEFHSSCENRQPCPDEEYRQMALQAEFGRIVCIGVIVENNQGELIDKKLFGTKEYSSDYSIGESLKSVSFMYLEKITLHDFWKFMKQFDVRNDLIIGHNILDFDLPFIYKRSIINQVIPTVNLSFKRYYPSEIYDTMWIWSRWQHRISLDKLCLALKIESPKNNGIDGGKVYEYCCYELDALVAEYCLKDVEAVRQIYYRMNFLKY